MTLIQESQLLNPDALVEMFFFDFQRRFEGPTGSTLFYTNEPGDVAWGGTTYKSASIQFNAPEISLDTNVNKGTVTIHGQDTDMLNTLNTYEKIRGSWFYYVLTHEKFLDTGSSPSTTEVYIERYVIDSLKERSKSRIVFEVTPGVGLDNLNKPALRSISV